MPPGTRVPPALAIADVASIDAKIIETQKSLQAMGPRPKPVCTKAVYGKKNRKTGKRPLVKGAKCTQPEWAGTVLLQQLETLQAERAEAAGNRDLAVQASAALETDIAAAKIAVAEAADKQRAALSQSQLHSFVGMVQGKAPVAVTDDELFRFLRIFIFVPALLIAASSTLLAIGSFTRLKPSRTVSLDNPALAKFFEDVADARIAAHAKTGEAVS